MEIVSTTGDSRISIVPRSFEQIICVVYRNISTDQVFVTDNFAPTLVDDNIIAFDFLETEKQDINLTEGEFASFEIYGAETDLQKGILLYRGRIFCTDQDIIQEKDQTYDVNQGEYKENESDNEFIIY